MNTTPPPGTLRNLLWLDAATCSLMGVLLLAAATPLGALTGLPAALLWYAGLVLLPIALFMALTAARRTPAPLAVRLIVLGNLLWVAVSLALLASTWIAPNALGVALIVAQAVAVLGLAILEQRASRHSTPVSDQLARG